MSLLVTGYSTMRLCRSVDAETAHGIRQTVAFTSIVILNGYSHSSTFAEKGVLQLGFFRNPWLLVCMMIGLGLQALVVYLPTANKVFHTQR